MDKGEAATPKVRSPLSWRSSGRQRRVTGLGHEERFPPPRLSGRCRFGQGTFAGASGNDEDAPEASFPLCHRGFR